MDCSRSGKETGKVDRSGNCILSFLWRRCSTATAKLPTNSVCYFCCEPLGGSEPCVSLVGGVTQLTASLMRCDKLSKLWESKTPALFLRGFPLFKRINRVCTFDSFL